MKLRIVVNLVNNRKEYIPQVRGWFIWSDIYQKGEVYISALNSRLALNEFVEIGAIEKPIPNSTVSVSAAVSTQNEAVRICEGYKDYIERVVESKETIRLEL